MKFDSLDSSFAYTRFHQVPSNRILTKLVLRFRSYSSSVHCEFSRIVCVSLFSYQGSLFLTVFRQLVYFIIFINVCQALFSSFLRHFLMICRLFRRLVYSITSSIPCQQLFCFYQNFLNCVFKRINSL